MWTIRRALPHERDRVNAFYASEGRSVTVEEGESWVLALEDEQVIGVLRVCCEEGHQVLRTVQIAGPKQRQGIGREMLDCAAPLLEPGPSFCLPYAYLTDFYGRIGFVEIPERDAPPHLRARLQGYRQDGRDMIVMRRG
jgi:N-acetylglutamate synthase-like GNAT family acetyltransferase